MASEEEGNTNDGIMSSAHLDSAVDTSTRSISEDVDVAAASLVVDSKKKKRRLIVRPPSSKNNDGNGNGAKGSRRRKKVVYAESDSEMELDNREEEAPKKKKVKHNAAKGRKKKMIDDESDEFESGSEDEDESIAANSESETEIESAERVPKPKKGRKKADAAKKPAAKKANYHGNKSFMDLTDIPPQPLILKNNLSRTDYKDNSRHRPVKAGSSKYTGVYYEKVTDKWRAQIMAKGKVCSIGYYEKEEDAAGDYARAAFKFKPSKGGCNTFGGLDLSGIRDQPLIVSNSASGYKGVKKMRGRWQARIGTGGKGSNSNHTTLGTFDDVEEAARIYARAASYLEQR